MATLRTVRPAHHTPTSWQTGGLIFGASMMVLIGIVEALQGVAAIVNDQFFVVTANYAYKFDVSTWGWIHLGLGLAVAAAGVYLFRGDTWSRLVAVILAGLSGIANFLYIPYYSWWSLLIIALDIFVIWAVITTRGEDVVTN